MWRKGILYLWFILLNLNLLHCGWVPEKIYNPFTEVKDVIETPHIVWSKPASDRLKVLIIGPAWGQRESVELMQRYDLDISVLMTHTHNLLSSTDTYGSPNFWTVKNVVDEFDKNLKDEYDVIIIGRFDWDKILTKHRYEILQKVYNGTGLIYISPPKGNKELEQLFQKEVISDIEFFIKDIPLSQLTAFKDRDIKEVIKAGVFGKGRWVSLNYRVGITNQILTPDISPYYKNDWEYEYYMNFLYKAILWAGKKDKKLEVNLSQNAVFYEKLPSEIEITVGTDETGLNLQDLKLESFLLCTRDGDLINIDTAKKELKDGEQTFKIKIPVLPEGIYIINFILKRGNSTFYFTSKDFKIETENRIEEIKLEKRDFKKRDEISGKVFLNKEMGKDDLLEIKLYDNFGRLLWKKEYAGGKEISFNFNAGVPYKSCIHYIETTLKKNNQPVSVKKEKISITGREKPSFSLSIWTEPQTDYISKVIMKRYYQLGIDSRFINVGIFKSEGLPEVIAESNLFSLPPFPHYWGKEKEIKETRPVHKKCLHNPEFINERVQIARDSAKIWSVYDVLVYGDGSDRGLGGLCFCDYTLKSFREWLREKYKNISNLNKSLQTFYKDWEEIIPDTLKTAKEKNNYSLWVEFVRFMENSYVEDMKTIKEAMVKIDPEALVGVDGYGRLNSSDGADWWKILQVVGFYNLYTYQDPPQLEITRSLSKYFSNVKYRTIYWGSYTGQFENETFMKYLPWYALFHNYNGLYWWTADGKTTYTCANGGIISPDLRITYPFYLSQKQIEKIRDGIYHLVEEAERENCGIAIHYSKTAIYAAEAFKSPGYYVASLTGFEKVLEDMGYQYDYITTEQIENGILKNFKVLILPFTLALSEKEAEKIEEFVKNGGILISYDIPGIYNYYLQKAEKGTLLKDIIGNPEEIFNAGKGVSLVTKRDITEYPKLRYDIKGREIRKTIFDLLQSKGIKPIINIKEFDENLGIPEVEVISYIKDNVRILSIINYRNSSINFNFKCKKSDIVYDILEKKLIRNTDEINVGLDNGEVKIYCILPSPIKDVILKGPDEIKQGKEYIFEVYTNLESDTIIPSSYRYEVFNPDGEKSILYSGVVKNKKGEHAKGIIPFALNDLPGKWKIVVYDTISGIKAEKEINLKR